jgi:ribosomal protein S18 acetylase RimI-like enzyme
MVTNRTAAEIRLVDIIVAKARRGSGAGTAALERLAQESDESGKPVRLTVRRDNPALRLYTRSGFQTIGTDELNLILERPPVRPPEI